MFAVHSLLFFFSPSLSISLWLSLKTRAFPVAERCAPASRDEEEEDEDEVGTSVLMLMNVCI